MEPDSEKDPRGDGDGAVPPSPAARRLTEPLQLKKIGFLATDPDGKTRAIYYDGAIEASKKGE